MSIVSTKHWFFAWERSYVLPMFDFWHDDGCWTIKVGPLFFGRDYE